MATPFAQYQNNFQFVDMKQQNRFIMTIPDYYEDGEAGSFLIRASDLPSLENNPVTVDTINAEYKIKGKSRWQDISVTFYDPILGGESAASFSGAGKAHDWIKYDHHNSSRNIDGYMQRYKRKITLKYIGPDGIPTLDYWDLYGAFFASTNWGSVDVSSDDLVLIEATISYDWAELNGSGTGGAGAAAAVGQIASRAASNIQAGVRSGINAAVSSIR